MKSGCTGYSHENPLSLSREQEEKILIRSREILANGEPSLVRPIGYVAPWWELSPNTIDLLQKYGVKYDHSLMHHDFQCYYAPKAETIYPIDYDKDPDEWIDTHGMG